MKKTFFQKKFFLLVLSSKTVYNEWIFRFKQWPIAGGRRTVKARFLVAIVHIYHVMI